MSLFVLLRLPISILLLLGFAVSNVWQEPGGGFFGVVFVVGLRFKKTPATEMH
jgi:hypothetical protein